MEYLFIYLLQICDLTESLTKFFIFIATIGVVSMTIIWAMNKDNIIGEEIKDFCIKKLKKISIISIIISFLFALLPTKQTLLLIGGTYYGKKAVNTVVTSDKIQKVNEIIDLQLDKYIKDLKTQTEVK